MPSGGRYNISGEVDGFLGSCGRYFILPFYAMLKVSASSINRITSVAKVTSIPAYNNSERSV